MNCGVVTLRCVCGETQLGAAMFTKEPYTHSSDQGGSFDASPKAGLDSPNVKVKAKRLKPPVSSLTRFGVIVRRQLAARFRPFRLTSPRGGNPGKTAGRAFKKSPSFVS